MHLGISWYLRCISKHSRHRSFLGSLWSSQGKTATKQYMWWIGKSCRTSEGGKGHRKRGRKKIKSTEENEIVLRKVGLAVYREEGGVGWTLSDPHRYVLRIWSPRQPSPEVWPLGWGINPWIQNLIGLWERLCQGSELFPLPQSEQLTLFFMHPLSWCSAYHRPRHVRTSPALPQA